MKRFLTATSTLALLLVFLVVPAQAQEKEPNRIPPEYESVVSTIQRVFSLLQDVTLEHAADPIGDQIISISDRLTLSGPVTGGFRMSAPDEDLAEILRDVQRELRSISRSLERKGEHDLADRLDDVLVDLADVIDEIGDDKRIRRSTRYGYEISSRSERIRIRSTDDAWWDDDDHWQNDDADTRWKDRRDDFKNRNRNWHTSRSTFVGDFAQRWPYQERGIYRNIPSFRYNRVEGLFLGFGRAPLQWSSYDRGRVFGQIGYALGLHEWLYEVGAESRFGSARRNNTFDIKIGGSYHRNTNTNDLWKSTWAENTAAAALFREDFFDYFQTEGWTAYAVARVTPYAQLSAGFRSDEYRSLSNQVTWSLFGGDDFRPNPHVNEGNMRSLVFTAEGGKVKSFNSRPRGAAFRFEAEIGQGLGGDFDFSRYVGDVRAYTRLTRETGLNVRLRAGFTEGSVPLQKAFTLGGAGSVRAYNQNVFLGTRMLLANVELALYEPDLMDWLFDDMAIFGIFDAGWTNSSGRNEFSMDDVIPAAGFGLSFDDRTFRLEIAWPLRDLGTGLEPSLWLRIAPTF